MTQSHSDPSNPRTYDTYSNVKHIGNFIPLSEFSSKKNDEKITISNQESLTTENLKYYYTTYKNEQIEEFSWCPVIKLMIGVALYSTSTN